MSCNGYHKLNWYYTYPQNPYKWTSIKGKELIEFQPQVWEPYMQGCQCPCHYRQRCQCPSCMQPMQQQPMQQQPMQQQPLQQQPPLQPVQSQGQGEGCGCSL